MRSAVAASPVRLRFIARRTFAKISSVAAIGFATALVASTAHAATTVYVAEPVSHIRNGGLYTDSTATSDQVTVGFDTTTDEFVVSDPAGVTLNANDPTNPCELESPTVARCPQLAPFVTALLGDGDDRFVGEASLGGMQVGVTGSSGNDAVTTFGRAFLSGGDGDDTLMGGLSFDRIRGDAGRDRLIGRQGRDNLGGGPGPDWLTGGRGDDFLRAEDGERDRSIRCGGAPGDTVIFDRNVDPAPVGCRHLNEPDAWP